MKDNKNKKNGSDGFKSESYGFSSFGSGKKNEKTNGEGKSKSSAGRGGSSINYSFGNSRKSKDDSGRSYNRDDSGKRYSKDGGSTGGSSTGSSSRSYGGDRPPRRYSKDGGSTGGSSTGSSSRSYGGDRPPRRYSKDGGSTGSSSTGSSRSYGGDRPPRRYSKDGGSTGSSSTGSSRSYGGDRPPRRYSKDGGSTGSSSTGSSRSYGGDRPPRRYSKDGGSTGGSSTGSSRSYGGDRPPRRYSKDGGSTGSSSTGSSRSYGGDRPPRRYSKDGGSTGGSSTGSSRSYGGDRPPRRYSKDGGSTGGSSTGSSSRSYGGDRPPRRYSKDGGSTGSTGGKKTFGSADKPSSKPKGSVKIERKDLQIEIDNPKKDAYCVAVAYNVETDFSKKSIKEAQDYPKDIEDVTLEDGRLDLRELYTVTIDGEDSKDFDDAISVEKIDSGYKLGIHIADVSHFVANDSALDKEARIRGNSVYLIDKVYPMFPQELSNGLCSLNEGVVRFTMSVFVEVDKNGDVISSSCHNSAIRSSRRLTYNYVQDVLDKKVEEADERLNSLIVLSNEVKDILLKKRIDNGTIEFDLNETKVVLDNNSEPIDFVDEKRKESHKIVEEFMLLANCEVAYKLKDVEGAIYRVHGNPDIDKLEDFERIAYNLGYGLKKDAEGAYDFQGFMELIRGKTEEKLLLTLLLRSMKQAIYDTKNIGHFGLGFKFYTHFTSPIRRYTDLLTHRLLKLKLSDATNSVSEHMQKFYKTSADWCSKTERVAVECERDLFKVKACRYLQKYIGVEFTAYVRGLTRFGIFAQIEEKGIEGLVRFADSSTYYTYDEESQTVEDKYNKIRYSMGDKIKIEVLRADIKGLFIDFTIKHE